MTTEHFKKVYRKKDEEELKMRISKQGSSLIPFLSILLTLLALSVSIMTMYFQSQNNLISDVYKRIDSDVSVFEKSTKFQKLSPDKQEDAVNKAYDISDASKIHEGQYQSITKLIIYLIVYSLFIPIAMVAFMLINHNKSVALYAVWEEKRRHLNH